MQLNALVSPLVLVEANEDADTASKKMGKNFFIYILGEFNLGSSIG